MNVEHIMQIAISVDDDAIKERAIEHAAREISKALDNGLILRDLYGKSRIGGVLAEMVDKQIQVFLDTHKEEFLTLVADNVSERLMRSKKFKEEVLEKIDK